MGEREEREGRVAEQWKAAAEGEAESFYFGTHCMRMSITAMRFGILGSSSGPRRFSVRAGSAVADSYRRVRYDPSVDTVHDELGPLEKRDGFRWKQDCIDRWTELLRVGEPARPCCCS